MRDRDDGLPEPVDLHRLLSSERELDWGDLPSTDQLISQYGRQATERSLELLGHAARVEPAITADVVSTIEVEGFSAYHLENRLKSPQSLARKLRTVTAYQLDTAPPPPDVLRYTVLVDRPDQVVAAAERTADGLLGRGWSMSSAHHSYVEGSRYKGLHLALRHRGQTIEVQVHSRESVEVKERTTHEYGIERDRDQPRKARDAAREKCVRWSAEMTQPLGIDELQVLGGVKVDRRCYGGKRPTGRADSAKRPRRFDDGARQTRHSGPAAERGNDEGMRR
ncbi:hypothetical protein [Kribbella lupini]|uniref:RelA/SpoT domain-containing protein n=1 Tax=Kribbella lupini TaxID=291602 RepID=A0ABN2BWN2_9ACTN